MSPAWKYTLIILGIVAALLVISQFAMGMMILNNPGSAQLRRAHQHSGYLTAAVALLYCLGSVATLLILPTRPKS